MSSRQILAAGCALFTMLFGAGNIIFPLILGRSMGSTIGYTLIGLILAGVIIPLLGFICVMREKGSYAHFLSGLGKWPSFLIALFCMTLLGPLGAIPRCVAIAYADLAWYLPKLSMLFFSIVAAVITALCTLKRTQVVALLGQVLGPIKILCLLSLVVLGLFSPGKMEPSLIGPKQGILHGFQGGFATMDLLAILFFSHLIYLEISNQGKKSGNQLKNFVKIAAVSGTLTSLVYIGFALLSALHADQIKNIADDTLLSALASIILGPNAGVFANFTIILTCLTTAIALTTTFADFLSSFVLKNRITYKTALFITILSSTFMANLRFSGIMAVIMPFVNLFYPALTVYCMVYLLSLFFVKDSKKAYGTISFFVTLMITFICIYMI